MPVNVGRGEGLACQSGCQSGYPVTKKAAFDEIAVSQEINKYYSDYRAHTSPIFYQFKTLCLPDMVNFNSMVFMYKVFNNSLTNNLLVYKKSVQLSSA